MPDNLSEQCSHNGPNAVRLGSMLDQDLLPLTNRRARIRPLRHADAEVYAAGTEDPLVRQFAHLPEDRYTSASVRAVIDQRSEEHTSELQSRGHLVCRLLLEKQKNSTATINQTKYKDHLKES